FDCEFLVCGFDDGNNPHIVSVTGHDDSDRSAVTIRHHDIPGFHAIGSGQYSALSILYHFQQCSITDLEDSIFNVAAAKFSAETAFGVGEATWLHILRDDSIDSMAPNELIIGLRDSWKSKG